MMKEQQLVHEFHAATGAHVGDLGRPAFANIKLRLDLIFEELLETAYASGYQLSELQTWTTTAHDTRYADPDLVKAIDGLGDLLYVLLGTAVEWGIDLEPYFREIHASNMTKVGGAVREDGKRLKPEGYRPPNLQAVYEQQLADYGRACKNRNCACRQTA